MGLRGQLWRQRGASGEGVSGIYLPPSCRPGFTLTYSVSQCVLASVSIFEGTQKERVTFKVFLQISDLLQTSVKLPHTYLLD